MSRMTLSLFMRDHIVPPVMLFTVITLVWIVVTILLIGTVKQQISKKATDVVQSLAHAQ